MLGMFIVSTIYFFKKNIFTKISILKGIENILINIIIKQKYS